MRNRTTQSALLVAGAAAGAAAAGAVAASWLGRRRLRSVETDDAIEDALRALREPESVELPIGRSADPEIDGTLTHTDASLDEIWSSLPGFAEGEQTEGYDAVTPEDLGAVWLERATQTTHDHPPHASDPSDTPSPESLAVSEASIASSHSLDDEDEPFEEEDDDIADDALDLDDDEEK